MKQLKPISLSQLTTTELQYFTLRTLGLVQPIVEPDSFPHRQTTRLNDNTDSVELLTGLSKKNEVTLTLNSADDIQDSILLGVRDTCKAKVATRRFHARAADSAENVLAIMDEYGKNLIYGNFDEQCTAIPSFLTKMATPENVENAKNAGILQYIEALQPAHDEFRSLLKEKLTNKKKPLVKLTDVKKDMRYRLEGLLGYLDLQIADEVVSFTDLKAPMNLLITDVMAQMRTRVTLAKKNA